MAITMADEQERIRRKLLRLARSAAATGEAKWTGMPVASPFLRVEDASLHPARHRHDLPRHVSG